MIREPDLSVYLRLRTAHRDWLILRTSPRVWTATRQLSDTATRTIVAGSLRTLEKRLDQIAAPLVARTGPPE